MLTVAPTTRSRRMHILLISSIYCMFAEDPKDLIRKCLVVEPENRITVKEALQHPFFTTTVSSYFLFGYLVIHRSNRHRCLVREQRKTHCKFGCRKSQSTWRQYCLHQNLLTLNVRARHSGLASRNPSYMHNQNHQYLYNSCTSIFFLYLFFDIFSALFLPYIISMYNSIIFGYPLSKIVRDSNEIKLNMKRKHETNVNT